MPEIRIIGGEFAGHTGGLPSGVMRGAAFQMLSSGPCPVCGAPDGSCKGDDVQFTDPGADPYVVMLREVEITEHAPGERRPRTWSMGGPGVRVRRSMAQAYAPDDAWMEIKDVGTTEEQPTDPQEAT